MGFDNGTGSQIKRHVTGEVEALRHVHSLRHVQHRASGPFQVLNAVHSLSERFRVQSAAVANTSIVSYGDSVGAIFERHYVGTCWSWIDCRDRRRRRRREEKKDSECEKRWEKHLCFDDSLLIQRVMAFIRMCCFLCGVREREKNLCVALFMCVWISKH